MDTRWDAVLLGHESVRRRANVTMAMAETAVTTSVPVISGFLMRLILLLALGVMLPSCGGSEATREDQPSIHAISPGPGVNPAPDETGDWIRPAKDYASTRFSALDQITRDSVKQLGVKATFSTGYLRGHEAAPLVVNGTMFVVTPFPNVLYALDLTAPGAPVKWRFEPKPVAAAQGVACCDVVNRGAVYADGTIFYNTLDNRTVAVNADTGEPRWIVTLGDINRGETITMAPLVVKDKVLVGNSGGEMGVRGWLTALRVDSGAIAWRAFHTGPDQDVLIGPRFKPFYDHARGADLGIHTWPGEAWKQGGGTMWGWISYDPQLNLIYYGTGNPGPWNAEQRPGDNKWTAGLFARDADTGEAVWFYHTAPHDLFDYDDVNEQVLVDLPIGGRSPPIPSSTSHRRWESTSRMGGRSKTRPRSRFSAKWCARSVRRRPAARTGSRRPTRRALAISTFLRTTSAWTTKRSRQTTSPVRPMSGPTCGCMPGRAAIAASSSRGIQCLGGRRGRFGRTFPSGAAWS